MVQVPLIHDMLVHEMLRHARWIHELLIHETLIHKWLWGGINQIDEDMRDERVDENAGELTMLLTMRGI